ncbi:MAG: hypothetical protein AABY15_01205 [Nanoarchaeota archaeon]
MKKRKEDIPGKAIGERILRRGAHGHIHRALRKHSPRGVHKAKRLLAFKYHKLVLLIAIIAFSYYLFTLPIVKNFVSVLNQFSYFSNFLAGILFSVGFTTPFSIGFLITSHPASIWIAAIAAGIGSVIGDVFIFKTIKFSFMDEFKELERKKAIKKIEKIVESNKHVLIRHYLIYIFAGIILATPLPDELGISMLAGLTTIKTSKLAVISFILHFITFFLILYFSAL